MRGRKSKSEAERKRRELETSVTGRGSECPPADTPDGQHTHKLAATVGYTPRLRRTRATLATMVVNSSGSTGFGMCML